MDIKISFEDLYKATCLQRDRTANSEAQALACVQVLREENTALKMKIAELEKPKAKK